MLKNTTILIIIMLLFTNHTWAMDSCSRAAVINYQEILIDTNSTQKGEGLRYYLEKDPVAIKHLNAYQKGTEIKWTNVAIGTAGSLLTIGGLIMNDEGNSKKSMIIGGISLLIINFLTAKTLAHSNERNLYDAVREYNRRNTPRIHYDPTNTNQNSLDLQSKYQPTIYLDFSRTF